MSFGDLTRRTRTYTAHKNASTSLSMRWWELTIDGNGLGLGNRDWQAESMRRQELFWVYILRCSDGSYYTGRTRNLSNRLAEHQVGSFGGYTQSRRPVTLAYSQEFTTAYQANEAERQIKGWSRVKKAALIAGDFDLLKHLSRCRNRTSHKFR